MNRSVEGALAPRLHQSVSGVRGMATGTNRSGAGAIAFANTKPPALDTAITRRPIDSGGIDLRSCFAVGEAALSEAAVGSTVSGEVYFHENQELTAFDETQGIDTNCTHRRSTRDRSRRFLIQRSTTC
jgi:hypothetical protein